jgi:uncharacterized protein (DUF58 family)
MKSSAGCSRPCRFRNPAWNDRTRITDREAASREEGRAADPKLLMNGEVSAVVRPSLPQTNRFIDPVTLSRIGSLELVARTVVEGFVSGLHRSPLLGFSVNFAEFRPYQPGDDIRKIDWKVFGRLDRLFVKEYEGETNTSVHLILDCSRSMAYGNRGVQKLVYGQFLAASLGYFVFQQRDSIGFISCDEKVHTYIPARRSMGHLDTVLHAIEKVRPEGKSDFCDPLVAISERLRRRGIVIVISDLCDEPGRVMEGLRHLAFRGNDVIVFQVLDPSELQFDFEENAEFIDMETREEMYVVPSFVRNEYRRLLMEQIAGFKKECLCDRMDYALLDTSQPLDQALHAYLLRRERLY